MIRQLLTNGIRLGKHSSKSVILSTRAWTSTFTYPNPTATKRSYRTCFVALGVGTATAVGLLVPYSRGVIRNDADDKGSARDDIFGRQTRIVAGDDVKLKEKGIDDLPFSAALIVGSFNASSVQRDTGLHRLDAVQLGSNFPCEDRMSILGAPFSPTLNYHIFGIYDGHLAGVSTAKTLEEHLPQILTLGLAHIYSEHAKVSSQTGIDIASGYSYHARQQNVRRNPGEPPNPQPPGQEIDAVIKAVFIAIDNVLVHTAAQLALGLTKEEYRTLQNPTPPSKNSERILPLGDEKLYEAIEDTFATVMFPGIWSKSSSKPSRAEACKMLANAYAGSCAVVAIYNTYERTLRVALTGDCRAVLGRRVQAPLSSVGGKGKGHWVSKQNEPGYVYEVHPLSSDHSPKNPIEASRVTALHPNEPDLLKNGRFLGWGPTRAFGDGLMKWSIEVQKRLAEECLGDRPKTVERHKYISPPYFTAEPEVQAFEGVRKGDFVVLASDGLWDCLENEEVIGLVGRWLEEGGVKERVRIDGGKRVVEVIMPKPITVAQNTGVLDLVKELRKRAEKEKEMSEERKWTPGVNSTYLPSELPVIYPANYEDKTQNYKDWNTEKKFISSAMDDDNVARHLLRNALGGADQDLGEALHKMAGTRRRHFKDDVTIQVVFFD